MATASDRLTSSLDRFQEAHFWIHMLEKHYHLANPFRWYLNVFLKALKEVPQLLKMELQNEGRFKVWFEAHQVQLEADPLIDYLSKERDVVVHRHMLLPKSGGVIGVTEGRGIKHGFSFPIDPLEDSDHAMECYLQFARKHGDVFDLLTPDEESLPCVQRKWKLESFDEELIELCATAWLRLGKTIAVVLGWLGEDVPPLSLDCRHGVQQVQFKRGGPHRLDHLAAFLRWTPQFLLPPVREILRGGEPEGKVPLRMFFQASVHLLRRRPSVRRVRSLAVV